MIHQMMVLGVNYRVKLRPHLVTDDDQWGNTVQRTHTVELDPDAEQPTVLIHEAIHTIEQSFNMEPFEEEHVHMLAKGIRCILGDNPEMVAYIVSELFRSDPITLKEIASKLLEEAK